jgi:hypothetical protein
MKQIRSKLYKIYDEHLRDYFEGVRVSLLMTCGRKYQKMGQCNCCGSCCKNISIKHGKKIIQTPEQFEALQRKFPVYRMFRIMDNADNGLIFQCVYLNDETGKCTNYENRPPICRNYPHEVIFKLGGSLADSCGYYFKPLKPFNRVLTEVQNRQ